MIIEGNLLIGILIVVALAIGALVVFIRFAVKKEPSGAETLFSWLLKSREKDEHDAAPDEATGGAGAGDDLSLPGPGTGGGKASAEEDGAKKPSMSVGLGGVIAGLLSSRKKKEQMLEEVRAIDQQLNSVLQGTEEINVPGMLPEISAMDAPLPMGRGMRELDMEMGVLQAPPEIVIPEAINIEPLPTGMAPAVSQTPAKPEDEAAEADRRKAAAAREPLPGAKPMKAADIFGGDKKDVGDDLLSDLETAVKQEEELDMSIMKEFQDMPITCDEIESDLKSILDQITINAQCKKNIRM